MLKISAGDIITSFPSLEKCRPERQESGAGAESKEAALRNSGGMRPAPAQHEVVGILTGAVGATNSKVVLVPELSFPNTLVAFTLLECFPSRCGSSLILCRCNLSVITETMVLEFIDFCCCCTKSEVQLPQTGHSGR